MSTALLKGPSFQLLRFAASSKAVFNPKTLKTRISSRLMSSISRPSQERKGPPIPRPSASILLISPTNQILLLHRVQTSSAFPSAYVFPGGNLSAAQDGEIPDPSDAHRHEDGRVYRIGAIRECFEESGILLAKSSDNPDRLLELSDAQRESARPKVHDNSIKFQDWLREKCGTPDIDNLIPFTRWVTPTNIPKRFTTQMYLYFLPLHNTSSPSSTASSVSIKPEAVIPTPTSDGGIEHTEARFLSPSEWLSKSRSGEIILFPPQFFLLHILSSFLAPASSFTSSQFSELSKQRDALMQFLKTGDPPWGEKCISPTTLTLKRADKRAVLGLDKAGQELEGTNRHGDAERVVLVHFRKEGPRELDVIWRKDVLNEERVFKENL